MRREILLSTLLGLALIGLLMLSSLSLQTVQVSLPNFGLVSSSSPFVVTVAADGSGQYTTINEGLNALPPSGGEVRVKDGDYLISSAISMPNINYVKLVAIGTNVRIYTTTPNINIIRVEIPNVEISGFHLVGEGTFYSWDRGNGILLRNVNNVTVRNVKIETVGTVGIYLLDSMNNTIEGADVSYTGKHGICLEGSTTAYNIIRNSTAYNTHLTGFMLVNGAHHNIIEGSQVHDVRDNGYYIDQGCPYNTIRYSKAYNITQNWNGGGQGMLIKASYASILYNEVWNIGSIDDTRGAIVFNAWESGIDAYYGNITGNYVHDNYYAGIILAVGGNNYVGRNWVEGTETGNGVQIESATDNILEYNAMLNNAGNDLSIDSSSNTGTNNYFEKSSIDAGNNIAPSLSSPPIPHP